MELVEKLDRRGGVLEITVFPGGSARSLKLNHTPVREPAEELRAQSIVWQRAVRSNEL